MTGHPPKSLPLLPDALELFEDESLTGRPAFLRPGTFNMLYVPGTGNTLFVPKTVVVVVDVTELCMPEVVNVPPKHGVATLALMMGASKGVEEVGGPIEGGGRDLREARAEGEGRAEGEWGE